MKNEPVRITTHLVHRTKHGEWFSADIGGRPLVGLKGGLSKFRSRKEAREAAKAALAEMEDEQ